MNRDEALTLLTGIMEGLEELPYAELSARAAAARLKAYEVQAPSGVSYQVEIQYFWDSDPAGDVRVIGSIDDGGWRAFAPLTSDFIKRAEG